MHSITSTCALDTSPQPALLRRSMVLVQQPGPRKSRRHAASIHLVREGVGQVVEGRGSLLHVS